MFRQEELPPTARQLAVLRYIAERTKNGPAPSYREIGDSFAVVSTNGVRDYVTALEKKGLLVRREREARSLRPTELGLRFLGVRACKKCRGTGRDS